MENQPLRALARAELPEVIAALGTRSFGPRLAAYADSAFGGHVCFAFHYRDGTLTPLAAGHVPEDSTNVLIPNIWRYTRQREWQRDMCLSHGMSLLGDGVQVASFHDRGGVETKRNWPWQIPNPLVDKLLFCESTAEGALILTFSRWGDCSEFDVQITDQLAGASRLLLKLAAIHRRLLLAQSDPSAGFGAAQDVERCLSRTTPLTRRELQVCALQLAGASGSSIAIELGIRADTVKSYRKRAYLRLGVSNEREMMLKYLALRANCGNGNSDLEAPLDPWRLPFLQA